MISNMQLIDEIIVKKNMLTVKINDDFKKYFVEDSGLNVTLLI